MDKSWRMKSSVPEQQYGQWEAKQRKYQPSMEQTEPITYSAVFQENGWRKVRQAHERRQAKTDPIKGQEACLLLTGIQ